MSFGIISKKVMLRNHELQMYVVIAYVPEGKHELYSEKVLDYRYFADTEKKQYTQKDLLNEFSDYCTTLYRVGFIYNGVWYPPNTIQYVKKIGVESYDVEEVDVF